MYKGSRVAAVIPARDEEHSIGQVVSELVALTHSASAVFDYIIVCDNCSSDATAKVAVASGANVVYEAIPGYGMACQTAINTLPPSDIIVFIDGDHAFFSEQSLDLIEGIVQGADLVIGSRTKGYAQPGALTFPQRFGNWLAAYLIKRLWRVPVSDLGPFRAISSSALEQIQMQDTRFGWTVEMQVKAIQNNLSILECAVDTRPRIGKSKISGTISGVIGAALGIFGTIFRLWRLQVKSAKKSADESSRP